MEKEIEALLRDFEIDIIFDMCDITEEEVLKILVEGGHIELPDWVPKW